ncbi:MAG: ComF family protein [Nannocystaceae bacterium]
MRNIAGIEALFAYQGPLSAAVSALKFRHDLAVAGPLGRLLAHAPIHHDGEWDLIVPVPLHARRLLGRGFNHSELIARWMIRALRPSTTTKARPRVATALRRLRATPPQTELPARLRTANVAGAFRPVGGLQGCNVLVVDDVTTTGATLHACIDTLSGAGARRVAGLALLRTLA